MKTKNRGWLQLKYVEKNRKHFAAWADMFHDQQEKKDGKEDHEVVACALANEESVQNSANMVERSVVLVSLKAVRG